MVQRVAIYCRVSTTDQSCERQERDLLEYAALGDFEVVGVWLETLSGTKHDRIERSKVMALAQSHSIDAILVTEMTRWGRSTIDLIETLQELHSWHLWLNLNGICCEKGYEVGWRRLKREVRNLADSRDKGSKQISWDLKFCRWLVRGILTAKLPKNSTLARQQSMILSNVTSSQSLK